MPGTIASDSTPVATILSSVIPIGDRPIEAAMVKGLNLTSGNFGDLTVITVTDLLGRQVPAVNIEASIAGTIQDEYYIGFSDAAGFGGGIKDPSSGQVLRGGGDIIAWIFREYVDIPFDFGRFEAWKDFFNAWQFDTWVNNRVSALEWLETEILAWMPAIARQGTRGLYFRPIRYDATLVDAIAYLSADRQEVQRESTVKRADNAIYNHLVARFQGVRGTGNFRQTRILTAEVGQLAAVPAADNTRVFSNRSCRISQSIYGVRERQYTMKSVWDPATANLFLSHLAARFALPKRQILYSAGTRWEGLEEGSIIALTDSELHLDNAVALILERSIEANEVLFNFVLLDDLAASPRLTKS